MSTDWIVPRWPAPATVRAVCTTRAAAGMSDDAGGQSRPPYDSLNLGDHVGDDALAVQANRRALAAALEVRPVFLNQVHGTQVQALSAQTPDGAQADGCITAQRGVACTIMVADCLPVLFTDMQGRAVAAAHAGWRGLAGLGAQGEQDGAGVLEATLKAFGAASGATAGQTLAWLGPSIGPLAFEVGPEVKAAFAAHDEDAAAMFRPHLSAGTGKWLADLPGLARQRLRALGVTQVYGNDGSAPWCTVSNASRFFSHRRDRVSGRFAACIWLV